MTGFARGGGEAEGCRYAIELKTVNARGLDIRLRVAPGLDDLEHLIRKALSDRLTRGAVNLSLSVTNENLLSEVKLNEQALNTALDAMKSLEGRIDADKPRLDGILALKGVLEVKDAELSDAAKQSLKTTILDSLNSVLDDLIAVREQEGAALASVIHDRLDEIEALTAKAEANPARNREAILARIEEQIAFLQSSETGMNEERLHQEALVLATKADIREELDRLVAHVAAARKLVAQGGPVGRKLDFLAQEFNREANTLCSKSNNVELTAIGLDLKAAIDQLREQIQNIE
jgi:uncharacterized protein (TIGR00255 family)